MNSSKPLTDRLARAKSTLILSNPFFASLLCTLPLEEDASVGTLATDGRVIKYAPDFLSGLTDPKLVFALAHEVGHVVFRTMTRRGNRDPERWNIATDYIINDILIQERIGTPIDGILIDVDLVRRGKGTAEGVYALLPETGKDGKPHPAPGQPGGALDHALDGASDASGEADLDRELQVRVTQAANVARMSGKLPGSLKTLIAENAKPRVDWRSVLRDFLEKRCPTDLTYARPSRRSYALDTPLPGRTGERAGHFAIALDCSGSITDAIIERLAVELRALHADLSPEMFSVIYFDSRVSHTDAFSRDDVPTFARHGGGGTDFAPVMNAVRTLQDVSALIVLTDLDCDSFGEDPGVPVLWLSTYKTKAPYGQVVPLKEDSRS
jgi:predicted metal-dependent peptidase